MKQVIFVDTNIIIEAHRTKCWNAVVGRYEVHIVQEVFEEALKGRKYREGYVAVDRQDLEKRVTIHTVAPLLVASAMTASSDIVYLDKGERDLLSFVYSQEESAWFLTTADKAAVRVACQLGFRERLRSLEELVGTSSAPLKTGYTKKSMDAICSECAVNAVSGST